MESQEPKPKKDIGLTTIELEIPETYIDDDNFFNNFQSSLPRNRL